jgi:hypothetical protein
LSSPVSGITNLCLPSEALAWWERRRAGEEVIAA